MTRSGRVQSAHHRRLARARSGPSNHPRDRPHVPRPARPM